MNLFFGQFVAHPICQQVLSSIWSGKLSGWRGSNTIWKLFVACAIFLTMPLLCLIYWLAPKSKVGKILKIPVIKFLLHSASYLWFLTLLLVESLIMERRHDIYEGRDLTIWQNSLHMIWVAGFLWHECKEVWIEGLRSYFLDWWNFLDIVTISMYLASFSLRTLVAVKGYVSCNDDPDSFICSYYTKSERSEWNTEDPQFIAEVLFAVTSMLSFTRLAYILPAHETLGTLQISIGKMIDDMIRFMFILMIILTAFLCGLNNIYVNYSESETLGNLQMEKLHITMVLNVSLQQVKLRLAMVLNVSLSQDDADVEWKFARSKLYLSYFREGLTLPVPFNIIPTPKALFYIVRGIFRIICCYKPKKKQDYPPIATISNRGVVEGSFGESRTSYRLQVIKALVQRYIDTARREFEEAKRKDLGNRITELNKNVVRLQSEVKHLRRSLADTGTQVSARESENVLSRYIMKVKNSFQNYDQESVSSGKDSSDVTVHQDSFRNILPDDDCPPYPDVSLADDLDQAGDGSEVGEDM
ncbi:unnamed protein product [Ranitomeya imitator]|uniref:Ion transport domain-containing protein n=1 Tax=Ranitomeya imitator TaxID=111125 RepID=A0ABN9M647_9NEOB|nr:unnamed protein product [Ranitomeya imitator]